MDVFFDFEKYQEQAQAARLEKKKKPTKKQVQAFKRKNKEKKMDKLRKKYLED